MICLTKNRGLSPTFAPLVVAHAHSDTIAVTPTSVDFTLERFGCELLFKKLASLFELRGAVKSSETGE